VKPPSDWKFFTQIEQRFAAHFYPRRNDGAIQRQFSMTVETVTSLGMFPTLNPNICSIPASSAHRQAV